MTKKLLLTLALAGSLHAQTPQSAWLYQDIAPQAYIRIPQQWTLLFANSARDPSALQPHWQTVQKKLALLPGSDKTLSAPEKTILDDILIHNNNALEIALYLSDRGTPHILIGAQFDYQDAKHFLAFAQAIAAALTFTHQGDGTQGRLIDPNNNLHIAYRYDPSSGKHWWLGSDELPDNIDWTSYTGTPSESLQTAAAQIDPQGQGFMFWIRNNPILLRAASDNTPWIKALQLLKLKSLSGGYAIDADGKPTLQLNIEIPPGGLRDLFPTQNPAPDIAVHGELESALAFTLPDNAGMQKILRIIDDISSSTNSYNQFKTEVQQSLKLDIEPLFNAFGGQWLILNDDFGQIYAIRKNEHWQTALDTLTQAGYLTLEHNDDTGITHARISLAQLIEPQLADNPKLAHPLLQALLKAPTHIYYQEESDHLIFADLPQPLIDRKRTTGGNHLGTYWSHAANRDNTLLATLKIDHLARRHYYSRLQWLQYLADLADTPIDIATLPSAQMLNLPEKSHIHAQIQSDPQNLRFKLIFENSLLDPIHHQSLYTGSTGIALLGILAAIALPAYDDYVERTNAAQHEAEDNPAPTLEDMSEADIAAIQNLITTLHRDSADLRNALNDDPLGESEESANAVNTLHQQNPEIADITLETGIYITFNDTAPAYLQHSELILWPSDSDPGTWHCYLNDPYLLGDTLLPPSCSPYDE